MNVRKTIFTIAVAGLMLFWSVAQALFIWVDPSAPTELQMSNDIRPSDIDTINRMVRSGELNQVRTVVLWDSVGGHVDTALDIGRWIHAHNLTTNVIGDCASACVHIALAGANKFISDGGALHVHWMYLPNDSYMTPVQVSHTIQDSLRSIWSYTESVGGKADAYVYLMMNAGPDLDRLSKAEAQNIGFVYR